MKLAPNNMVLVFFFRFLLFLMFLFLFILLCFRFLLLFFIDSRFASPFSFSLYDWFVGRGGWGHEGLGSNGF